MIAKTVPRRGIWMMSPVIATMVAALVAPALAQRSASPAATSFATRMVPANTAPICGRLNNIVLKNVSGSDALKQLVIERLDGATLCAGADWHAYSVKAPGPADALLQIDNFQQSVVGAQAIADITQQGLSAPGTIGGLDIGVAASTTDYCLWLVSDGTNTGLVWSKRCFNGGPDPTELRKVGLKDPYYYGYVGWNVTNDKCPGAECAFLYSYVKTGFWVRFSEESMPVVLTGVQKGTSTQWAPIFMRRPGHPAPVSPTGSVVLWSISNSTPGTHAAVAPNIEWGNTSDCDNTGGPAILCGPMAPDRGVFGFRSTSASATLRVAGFEDNF
jgi:hypothetical protein